MNQSETARTLDCHAHYVSPLALRAAEQHPERYGVRIQTDREGQPQPSFGDGKPQRAFPPEILRLNDRGQQLPDLSMQLTSCWMDVTGYGLPADEGIRWSTLLNDGLAEDIANTSSQLRFAGMATVPMQAPEAAARELERCVRQHGFRGAMICTNVGGENLDAPGFDVFWQQAQELRVPVILHPSNVALAARAPRYYLENLVGNPADTTLAAASLIFGGVLDRFPELQIVLVHAGGFLPYQWGRLNQGRRARRETDANNPGMPGEYLRRFFYDSIIFSPGALRYLVEVVGADRVLIGTDYPFVMSDMQPVQSLLSAQLGEAAVQQICAAMTLSV